MIEQPDLLAERFAALTNRLDDSDWRDVRRRARTASRRWLLIPVAAAIAVIAAGSALAVYREVVDFFSAEPAPERIQLDFEFLREHTAEASSKFGGPKFTTEGPAREVMRVQIDGEARPLWVVPTREGGFCYRLHFHGSCLTPDARADDRIGAGGLATRNAAGFDWLVGTVRDERVQEVELLYQDGERARVPFVWVSPPIDAGFYAHDVPEEHEQSGHLTVAVIGRDEDGDAVGHTCLRVGPDEIARSVPEAAAFCERRLRRSR
jgi:hypothetical protein